MGRTTWLLGWDDDNGDDTDCGERGWFLGWEMDEEGTDNRRCVYECLLFFPGVSFWVLCWFFSMFASKVDACFGVELGVED